MEFWDGWSLFFNYSLLLVLNKRNFVSNVNNTPYAMGNKIYCSRLKRNISCSTLTKDCIKNQSMKTAPYFRRVSLSAIDFCDCFILISQ